MNYKQRDNTCFGFPGLSVIKRATGKAPKAEEVYSFYREAGFDLKKGVPVADAFFRKWANVPLAGVKIKAFKPLWFFQAWRYRLSPLSLYNRLKNGNFILTVRLPIELDEKGFMKCPEIKRGNTHMVALNDLGEDFGMGKVADKYLILENSWGDEWGQDGFFKIRLLDVFKCCEDVWEVEL